MLNILQSVWIQNLPCEKKFIYWKSTYFFDILISIVTALLLHFSRSHHLPSRRIFFLIWWLQYYSDRFLVSGMLIYTQRSMMKNIAIVGSHVSEHVTGIVLKLVPARHVPDHVRAHMLLMCPRTGFLKHTCVLQWVAYSFYIDNSYIN